MWACLIFDHTHLNKDGRHIKDASEGPKRPVNPVHSALESNGVKEESWYQNRVLLNLTRINGVPLE